MNNLEDIIEDVSLEPKARRRKLEPKNSYEFCQAFSRITGMPIGRFLKDTKHWPKDLRWHFELQSLCKEKTREKQAITINWFVRECMTKEVPVDNVLVP